MIVDTTYNILSLITVLVMLITRDFLIPLFVWQNYLKDKSYSYKFFFSIISQGIIIINLVLILGLLGICNKYTLIIFNICIYALIMWNFSNKKSYVYWSWPINEIRQAYRNKQLARLFTKKATLTGKNLKSRVLSDRFLVFIKTNWLELTLLLAITIYNIWFLNYNVLKYHSYQFSDIPVHQSWIYYLEQGVLFSDGIYPFGMHAMAFFIRSFFAYDLREILLYSGSYQTVIMMIFLYLLAKEIFKGKYSAITSVIIVSLMLRQGRYVAALPQEAGMCFVVAMAYFLIRYLHKDQGKIAVRGDEFFKKTFRINSYINRKYIDDNLVLFMLSVALITNYHYFTAIAAIFLVIAILLAYLHKVIKKQYFVPIIVAGLIGGLIALLPIGVAISKGIPFQESMNWATTVISGEEYRGTDLDYQDNLNEALGKEKDSAIIEAEEDEKIDYSKMKAKEKIEYFYDSIYSFGRMSLFGDEPTKIMILSMIISFLLAIIMFLFTKTRNVACDYLGIIFYVLVISVFGAAKLLGVPEIILESRASTFAQPFLGIIFMMPIDIIFRFFKSEVKSKKKKILDSLSLLISLLVIVLIFNRGYYHNFFDVNMAYYNEPEYVLRNIKDQYEKNDFTIVATTDEYYQVINHGRHTEISKFVNMIEKNEDAFTIPTRYTFFFIEKVVLQDYNYGQVEVNKKYANMDFVFLENVQDYYFQRAIIQSKAYFWAESFEDLYPRNFKVFFENDIYLVYRMEQNTYFPFNLQIDYL